MQELQYITVHKVGNGFTVEAHYSYEQGGFKDPVFVVEGFDEPENLGACIISAFDEADEMEASCKK